MRIELTNTFARVTSGTMIEKSWLATYLEFESSDGRFRKGGGKLNLYNVITDVFPTGLLPLVKRGAAQEGFQLEIIDGRRLPCPVPDAAAQAEIMSWLYDYQLEAAQRLIGATRGILWIPTAGGKTEVATGLAKTLRCSWLFLVHRASLLEQTAARFEKRTGEKAGIIGDGVWAPRRFTVGTFQTLHAAFKAGGRAEQVARDYLVEDVDGLIVDEAHTLPANTFWKTVMLAKNAYWRIGMSGTPLARGDRKSIYTIGALGPVVYRIQPNTLIEKGAMSKPTIKMKRIHQTSAASGWQDVYRDLVVQSPERNKAIIKDAIACPKPAMLFVKEVAHGRALEKALLRAGLRAQFVWGQKDIDTRQAAVKRLVRDDLDVLIATVIFQEGVDIPSLASVIIGSGGKSIIDVLQKLGRGSRVERDADGNPIKTEFNLYDYFDTGHPWMERHTKQRHKAYTTEGYEVEILGDFAGGANAVMTGRTTRDKKGVAIHTNKQL